MAIQKDFLRYVSLFILLFGAAALSFLIPTFGANGGDNPYSLLIIALGAFLFLYLAVRGKGANGRSAVIFSPIIILSLALFSIVAIITDVYAVDLHAAVLSTIEWFLAFAICLGISIHVRQSSPILSIISTVLVTGASALSIYGLITFTQNLGYLHLSSIFPEHNPFGGFLLIPLCLSVAFAFTVRRLTSKWFYALTTILIGTAFILTFSRGSWVCLLIGSVAGAVFFRKQLARPSRSLLLRAGAIAIACVALSSGFYLLAQHVGAIEAARVSVYGGEVVPVSSTSARLTYAKDAVEILIMHPLGVGLGSYPAIAQATRSHVLDFSFDPHDIYLRMMTETGIIGGVLFILFMLAYYFRPAYSIYVSRDASVLSYALAIGVGAALLHNAIDFDANYPVALFTLFVGMGLFYGSAPVPIPDHPIISSRALQVWLASIAGVALILCLCEFLSQWYTQRADSAVANTHLLAAIPLYQAAERFDPLNRTAFLNEGQVYYQFAEVATGDEKTQFLEETAAKIRTSLSIDSADARAYEDLSLVYEQEQDLPNAVSAMERSVALDPLNNLDRQVRLLELYAAAKDYVAAITLVDRTTAAFPPAIFSSPIWGDPSKPEWKKDLIGLTAGEAAIYTLEGNAAASARASALRDQYAALPY